MRTNRALYIVLALLILGIAGGVSGQNADSGFTVGFLSFDLVTFKTEMDRLGYVEGENITYMSLNFESLFENPAEYAAQYDLQLQAMLDAPVDILVVTNDTEAVNLRERAGDIPIVFLISDDPVTTGAVADLTTPGGLNTGGVSNQHHPRRLQLLTQINPDTKKVYYLYSATALEGEKILEQVTAVGESLGVEVIPAPVADVESGLEVLANAPEDIDWLFLTPFLPFDVAFTDALVAASVARQAPIAGFDASANPYYLINYGPDLTAIYITGARVVDNIFRGALPAELPVVVAENGLAVNLEVAASLNMDIPVAVLRQADVIVRPGDLQTPVPAEAGN